MDVLSDILSHVKLAGTLYFRTEFSGTWGVQVPAFSKVARFHYAHRGGCFVRVDGAAGSIRLNQGDLIIVPRGAAHTLFSHTELEHRAWHLDRVVEESGFTGRGALVFGDANQEQETQLVCGHFAFDDVALHPLIESLPESLHLKHYGDAVGTWMESTLRVIGSETEHDAIGSELIAMKLSEIVFAQALRTYLQKHGSANQVMAGFADDRISRALSAIHDRPGHGWNVQLLASVAAMSRTSFMSRFSETMNTTPMGYVTYWRMELAKAALRESRRPIIDVAESVGYQSEAAFCRVFKRQFATTPAAYRRQFRLRETA